MRHPEQLSELYLFNHLPRDGLERRKREQQLSEPTTGLVLPVANVVFEVSMDLLAHAPDTVRLVEAFGIYTKKIIDKIHPPSKDAKLTEIYLKVRVKLNKVIVINTICVFTWIEKDNGL